jgi:hypothetical protein
LEILVQETISKPAPKVYAKISTEILGLEDVVHSLSEIIDDERLGYHRLPFMDARSESIQRLDAYTSLRKVRVDKAYVVSNGRNTIYMLDYVEKSQKMYHDPVICVVGPEATEIAQSALKNLSRILVPRMYNLRFDDEAIKDFSNLAGYKKADIIKELSEIFEEAELALKMKFLSSDRDKTGILAVKQGGLSEKIIEDIKSKPFSHEPIDIRSIIPFGIIVILIMLLLALRL